MKLLRKAISILLLLSSIIFIIASPAWLSIILIVSVLIYWIGYSDYLIVARFRNKKWLSFPLYFIIVVLYSIGIRLFIIEIYAISSVSMEDTLLPGDKIIMSKLSYGPRLPSSPFEIPLINVGFYLNREYRSKADSAWWKYKRLHGFVKIKHGDVAVFIVPKKSEDILIKRCVGLPGDTLSIKDEKIIINSEKIHEEKTIKLRSRILYNNYTQARALFDSLELDEYNGKSEKYFSTILNNKQKGILLSQKCIDSIVIETDRPDATLITFPYSNLFKWTVDNFGPVVVPSKGMKIQLNEQNFLLYNKIMSRYENAIIEPVEGIYFLNGTPATSYSFTSNYYFMLGDNRHDSNDSRYWGFVPEMNILGKASLILFSNGEKGLRWKRFFKKIS
jgi:signal peptidase I